MQPSARALGLFAATLALALGACGDPLRSRAQDALPGEVAGVPKGPNHRAGQPCLVCHDGSTAAEFSIAGTLFVTSTARSPLVGGVVILRDRDGVERTTTANCVGNFYIPAGDYTPKYPLQVRVSYGDKNVPMKSSIHREGACGACHSDPVGPTSPGHVYFDDVSPPAVGGCP